MKVGYLGPESSFTYQAAKKGFPNEQLVPFPSIPACIKAVEYKDVELAVVPIENTLEGSVNTTVDYLYHQSFIPVGAELILPIHQQLMVAKQNQADWQQITKIMSHPQALAQSANFIQAHFPDVQIESTPSTAYAAQYVAEHPKELIGAIAPKSAAQMYQTVIVSENIQDVAINHTRFWVIGQPEIVLSLPMKKEKMTVAITMPLNTPGSLLQALSAFGWRQIDLSKIESRPLKTSLGEYFFLLDVEMNKPRSLVENAIEEIQLLGGEVKVFGQYGIYPVVTTT
ncbi:prephenate dehydratase [Enterococcus sp. JM4C]|uniref:prephenate dehydratase n=1 Tax=Candidatus Enterococcus huntleyi TaxID=1857217 RepID=UPI00137B2603|nr:prephenate dehydratase [Enterococcus sp. JM4C]KAF1296086.1 prephenate dehydratase [Enterococcus sp. JM4C]